jgi:acyl dehydratase
VSSSPAELVEKIRARIASERISTESLIEAGQVRRFAEAIGDPNPRWLKEAPPTFLVTLSAGTPRIPEALQYGRGWLNGGNRFEYLEPVLIGDTVSAESTLVDAYEKQGGSGNLLFLVFETQYRNQHGRLVARSRNTGIRR